MRTATLTIGKIAGTLSREGANNEKTKKNIYPIWEICDGVHGNFGIAGHGRNGAGGAAVNKYAILGVVFAAGFVVGQLSLLLIIGLFSGSKDQPQQQGVPADASRFMMEGRG